MVPGKCLSRHPCPRRSTWHVWNGNTTRAVSFDLEVWLLLLVSYLFFSFSSYIQLKNRGMSNYCFDYNPPSDHNVAGNKIILYPCHGLGQNQVGGFKKKKKNPQFEQNCLPL